MKLKYPIFLLFVISFSSCEIDNFEEPQLTLSGRIVDSQTGELIESGGINAGTTIRLYEEGSGQPLIINTLPNGTFEFSKIFSGDYSYTAEGPFEIAGAEDTTNLAIQEDTEVEIQVIPNVRLSASVEDVDGTSATVNLQYEKVAAEQELVELGIVWSEFRNPDVYAFPDGGIIVEQVVVDSLDSSSGERLFVLEDLEPNTKYYVRGFAVTDNQGNYYNYSSQMELQTQ